MTVKALTKAPEAFSAPAPQWWQAIAYCALLSLLGLQFVPAILPIVIFLLWRWRNDRYAFLVELMILMGGYALVPAETLPFKTTDVALVLGVVGVIIYRKNQLVMKATLLTLAYFAVLFLLALTSVESMGIQFLMMRNYLAIISFFIPLLVFANREFQWTKFMDRLVIHALVICGFYVVDTFIFSGYLLLPGTSVWNRPSTIFNPDIQPFSFKFPRHYPPGLYWLFALIVALNYKELRLSWKQWALIALAIYASRTNSFLFAMIACIVLFRPKVKQVLLWAALGAVFITAGYFVDKATGGHMRLASNVEQFTSLSNAQDAEDLAEFGTGRMAQIIPKWELLAKMDREWVGFGFLHQTKTTNPVFQIENEFYSDVSKSDEIATAVEVTQVQTILDCGIIGLIVQTLFFFGLYYVIRPTGRAPYYLCAVVGMSVCGIGGFSGLIMPPGLLIVGTMLGAALLDYRTRLNQPLEISENKKTHT